MERVAVGCELVTAARGEGWEGGRGTVEEMEGWRMGAVCVEEEDGA